MEGQGGLGLVEHVEAAGVEAGQGQIDERLPVRALMEGLAAEYADTLSSM